VAGLILLGLEVEALQVQPRGVLEAGAVVAAAVDGGVVAPEVVPDEGQRALGPGGGVGVVGAGEHHAVHGHAAVLLADVQAAPAVGHGAAEAGGSEGGQDREGEQGGHGGRTLWMRLLRATSLERAPG